MIPMKEKPFLKNIEGFSGENDSALIDWVESIREGSMEKAA
jgi:hypothetical protein